MDTLTEKGETFGFSISEENILLLQKEHPGFIDTLKALQIKTKQAVNSYLSSKTRKETLIIVSMAIIPLVFIRSLFDFFARLLFSIAGNRAVLNIRTDIFSHLIKLPFKYFHKERSGEIISRITRDVIPLTTAVSTEVYNFISGIMLLVTNIIILSIISWKMILFILLLAPFIAFPIARLGNMVRMYTRKIQEGFADASSHLQETFSGIKVIKSFGMERYESARFKNINNKIFSRDLKRRIFQNLNPTIVELLGAMATIALFIYGGYQIINGRITSGEFIFFILIVLNLFDPVKMISNSINGTKAGEAAAHRIIDIMQFPVEDFTAGTEGSFSKSIEFRDISFKYADDFILKDINISIPRGKTTAIVGSSGSGKSTILNMITAFYSPTKGEIFFDDINEKDLSLNWIRKGIAFVTQEIFLFHGSILENITCGKNVDMQRVIEAAKIAHAHEFITKLPGGYNTTVGERGTLLSGGERQRISIARAILSDPEIILFDEATSALDSESEKMIQDSLSFLLKGRTSVIVSHRSSTIQYADLIYFIENGTIADKGTHSELMSRNESYRMLFNYDASSL
ncbi:MAG: ABC transporter ATP-binding protein [bacterium]|nr:ABC transporter ATP-binding protein [bacterium]